MFLLNCFFVLFSLLYVLVVCEIPDLNVRRLDRNLIAKKRQDNLEMCRLFTAENAKLEQDKPVIIPSYKPSRRNLLAKRRHKRQVDMKYSVNPALNEEDAKRVESIVEKLYDDMEENGEKVTYRQANITTTAKAPVMIRKNNSRRLFFAPAVVEGPLTNGKLTMTTDSPIIQRARWKHGIVPYFIDSKTYDAQLQLVIMKAFDYIEKATCIRLQKLRERPTDKKSLQDVDWVYITNPSGIRQCVHSNEKRKINGVQMIVFGYDCMSKGDIVHEVMHILGFSHEHTRRDRDQYVSILWDNIKPGYKKYFELNQEESEYNLENLPYDYSSVLHYPARAFSRNGQVTILTSDAVKIGQREGLSEIDVQKVGLIYSSECVERNRDYLLKTCPSVVKLKEKPVNITQKEIDDYFKDRLWPYGIVSYKLRDKAEFSTEERINLKAVFHHIEKETCIQFRDITEASDNSEGSPSLEHKSSEFESDDSNKFPEIIMLNPVPGANIDEDDMLKLADDEISGEKLNMAMNENDNIITSGISEERSPGGDLRIKSNDTINTDFKITTVDKAKDGVSVPKRVRRQVKQPNAERRHANSIIELTRSPLPGCTCPTPGKRDGNQVLEINGDCFNSANDLLHLFVHVLGLDHQHNMYDRDNYLHIVWKNLNAEIKNEMQKKLPPAASVGFPYDYQSVMHYPWLQIKEGVTNVMYPIWNDGWAMGHWQGLSSLDVQKLNLLYFSQCVERQKTEQE